MEKCFNYQILENKRNIAIGDIHGCAKTFRSLLEDKIKPAEGDCIFMLGDYIDRGPDSKGVIDLIFEMKQKGIGVRCLKGNHEAMLLDSFPDDESFDLWKINGGDQTLKSFGVNYVSEIPIHYMIFFQTLEYFIELEDFILVHAGINYRSAQPYMDYESMLWMRGESYSKEVLKGKKVIHGHTPITLEKVIANVKNAGPLSINLDSGCIYKELPGFGHLAALDLDSMELYSSPNIDT